MRWRLQFYNERDGVVAGYAVEAPTPAAAVLVGRDALRAEHHPIPARRRVSGYTLAQRLGAHDASGWVLYRIAKDDVPSGDTRAGRAEG